MENEQTKNAIYYTVRGKDFFDSAAISFSTLIQSWNADVPVDIYFFVDSVLDSTVQWANHLKEIFDRPNVNIMFFAAPTWSNEIKEEISDEIKDTLWRFDAPFTLNDYDKLLYLGNHTFIQNDLSGVFNLLDENAIIAGAPQIDVYTNPGLTADTNKMPGIGLMQYINTDVMLIDRQKFIEKLSIQGIIDFANQTYFPLTSELVINSLVNGSIQMLLPRWNFGFEDFYMQDTGLPDEVKQMYEVEMQSLEIRNFLTPIDFAGSGAQPFRSPQEREYLNYVMALKDMQ